MMFSRRIPTLNLTIQPRLRKDLPAKAALNPKVLAKVPGRADRWGKVAEVAAVAAEEDCRCATAGCRGRGRGATVAETTGGVVTRVQRTEEGLATRTLPMRRVRNRIHSIHSIATRLMLIFPPNRGPSSSRRERKWIAFARRSKASCAILMKFPNI